MEGTIRTSSKLAAVAAFCVALAACSGGGNSGSLPSTPPQPTATATASGTVPLSVISSGPGNQLAVTGTIIAKIPSGIQLEGGDHVGYFNVYTSSSTSMNFTPQLGEFISASGTGTPSTSMQASSLSLLSLPSAPVTASGQVTAMITGGFTMSSSGKNTNVFWIYSTKYTGAKPAVGATVTVSGLGSVGGSIVAQSIAQGTASATPTPAPAVSQPAASAFMPSSWGKISAFQIFDDTQSGYVPQADASAHGYRYSAVWGSRTNIGTSWLDSNPTLQTSYYNALETDESPSGWGSIGHSLSWWQANHPDWILYACNSSGVPQNTPAWVPGLPNVPLDIHNPAVANYQIHLMAGYAHSLGYHALAIDEATFWQADAGAGAGSYGCGIRQNGQWVQRYNGVMDPNWATDVVAWVKQAHTILATDPTIAPYHLKLIVNHPANQLTANETALLGNVDAVLDETGYTDFGGGKSGSASSFVMRTDWARYAQQHGIAVLMNAGWGSQAVGAYQLDYSVATYLMGNEQAESLYVGQTYGTEQWHSQYQTQVGAPCGEYYGGAGVDPSNPSIYYRRFANAIVVVNGGSGSSSEVAHLPSGHTYTDLMGRPVSNPLTVTSNDGYVLLTSNGCQ
jgi:hypothetical protein